MSNITCELYPDSGLYEVCEYDDFTKTMTLLASGTTEQEAWDAYTASLPKATCDLENPHLCESCQ